MNEDYNSLAILNTQTVKAGRRFFYIDVKESKTGDKYISVTESKKLKEDNSSSFEKHRIIIYQRDIEKFLAGMNEAVKFLNDSQRVSKS